MIKEFSLQNAFDLFDIDKNFIICGNGSSNKKNPITADQLKGNNIVCVNRSIEHQLKVTNVVTLYHHHEKMVEFCKKLKRNINLITISLADINYFKSQGIQLIGGDTMSIFITYLVNYFAKRRKELLSKNIPKGNFFAISDVFHGLDISLTGVDLDPEKNGTGKLRNWKPFIDSVKESALNAKHYFWNIKSLVPGTKFEKILNS